VNLIKVIDRMMYGEVQLNSRKDSILMLVTDLDIIIINIEIIGHHGRLKIRASFMIFNFIILIQQKLIEMNILILILLLIFILELKLIKSITNDLFKE